MFGGGLLTPRTLTEGLAGARSLTCAPNDRRSPRMVWRPFGRLRAAPSVALGEHAIPNCRVETSNYGQEIANCMAARSNCTGAQSMRGRENSKRVDALSMRGRENSKRVSALSMRGRENSKRVDALSMRGRENSKRVSALSMRGDETSRFEQKSTESSVKCSFSLHHGCASVSSLCWRRV